MKRIKLLLLLVTIGSLATPQAATALAAAQLSMQPGAGLQLTGEVGTVYAIQCTTNLLQPNAWRCLSLLKLPASPYQVPGTAPTALGSQFYRAVTMAPTNLVFILPGTFVMGSPTNEVGRYQDEGPQTTNTLSQGFWMAIYLVTQEEYQSVMAGNPSDFTGDPTRPVERVQWFDATNYCAQLTQRELAAGRLPAGLRYRLPTEAEWEYACRAGTSTRFYYGNDPGYANLGGHAWYSYNSANQTQPVGQKPANPWGLYDICGNVWEWCQDWYDDHYPGGSQTDPQGPATGQYRVLRGGSWDDPPSNLRSACRYGDDPAGTYDFYGFRVVLAPER